jgi:DNA modification methylase
MIELRLTDCMEYLKGVPDKYFNLGLIDPPYGIKRDEGFDMVCCELDKDYFESAVTRVLNHAKQLDMFNPAQEINIFR